MKDANVGGSLLLRIIVSVKFGLWPMGQHEEDWGDGVMRGDRRYEQEDLLVSEILLKHNRPTGLDNSFHCSR